MMLMPFGMAVRLKCGRWDYRCDWLFCQKRCVRLDGDDHGRGEHRCEDHNG